MKLINEINLWKSGTAWRKNGDWKARYSKLYSSKGLSMAKKEEPRRISFMSNDSTPYASLLIKLRASQKDIALNSNETSPHYIASLMSQSSKCYGTDNIQKSANYDELETSLLNMVRSRSREAEDEVRNNPLVLACEDTNNDANIYDACVHGLSIRMTDRSVSRSRISRMSTRRDMDIPSILAFTATVPKSQTHLEIPAFQKIEPKREKIPRWSIRRSICPVCSQKWRDRSNINGIKSSGLRRNLSYETPSVKAPARLRTSITMGCTSRNIPEALDQDIGVSYSSLRNTSATWQLTRARRFRTPKLLLPPPEATAPPSCNAPLARKDLDLRVSRFLSDNFKIQ